MDLRFTYGNYRFMVYLWELLIYDLPAGTVNLRFTVMELGMYENRKCKFFDIDALISQNAAEGGENFKGFSSEAAGR